MPCLDEAETIGTCIEKARRYLSGHAIAGEIVVADNRSRDGSQEIAAALGARVVHVEPKGYGNALLAGIAAARGRYVIMGDADDSYDFSDLDAFVDKLRQGFNLVMGYRFQGPSGRGPCPRCIGTWAIRCSRASGASFRSPSGDFHCGLRGFSRAMALKKDPRTTGIEFASEIVVKATLHGMRIGRRVA